MSYEMAKTQPQPNLEIFSLTFDGYIDASKLGVKERVPLKGTRNMPYILKLSNFGGVRLPDI